ncbi:hypothetical protein JG688_00017756 [Phytophthora aleatoria]|uniref:Uncharacterized protein n=1 Tax=Phytophthora aleatoria TaxID=2496075 RepID=A0A8J5LV46_9STRA|nr:hypothetical protein JG688_00017756 [Phytophthora aleatoria]
MEITPPRLSLRVGFARPNSFISNRFRHMLVVPNRHCSTQNRVGSCSTSFSRKSLWCVM